jgi:hypothetical protein
MPWSSLIPSAVKNVIAAACRTTAPNRTLEVERKFRPTLGSFFRLRDNGGTLGFNNFKYISNLFKSMTNTSITKGLLSAIHIWVSIRNRKREAKVRVGGNYTNLQFVEYKAEEDVKSVVS